LLKRVQWVSLGGGIHFVADDYPLDAFCTRLKVFAEKYGVQCIWNPAKRRLPTPNT
jgi:carboxynorspermidine decarboxylase